MNERMKVLAEQAKFIAEETINKKISKNAELDAFAEKFAELIVQECISLIREQSIGEEILGGQRYKTVQLGETIATITEHFGVKE
jgi:hypothetical protein